MHAKEANSGSLDRNHDGKLSPEECGQGVADSPAESPQVEGKLDLQFLKRARLEFMRFHPVLAALDADHDGQISASEIQNAAAALKRLDKDGDGKLNQDEVLPDPVANAVGSVMRLDTNGDGRISKDERSGGMAALSMRHSLTALGAYYRHIARRKDGDVAVFATARKLATLIYRLLRWGQPYVDEGAEAYEKRYKEVGVKSLTAAARDLGHQLTPASTKP